MTSEQESSGPPPLPRPTADTDWADRLELLRERLLGWTDRRSDEPRAGDRPRWHSHGRLVIWIVVFAVGAFVSWLYLRQTDRPAPVESLIPQLVSSDIATPAPTANSVTIIVHVAGAVAQPGLVQLAEGARVAQAIEAAGGPAGRADLERINLALALADEDRVFVPTAGEDPPVVLAPEPGRTTTDDTAALLDLNQASATDLEALPGVGPATAAAIVAYRDSNGPFSQVAALETVPGIGPAKLAQLRDLVTVTP